MRKARLTILQGDPGHGKSMMAGLTAPRRPAHFLDIDRKVLSAAWAQPGLASGDITVWELREPTVEGSLSTRLKDLATKLDKARPLRQPQGITLLAEYIASAATKDPNFQKAGTIVIDSYTMIAEHAKAHIMFWSERSKFVFDNWTAFKTWHLETMSCFRDMANELDKDFVITVHERDKETPGAKTRAVEVTTDDKGNQQRMFIGEQDLKVWASIDGAFGDLIGLVADEYYWLYVEMVEGKPRWRCRVRPEGKRALRTSLNVDKDVFEPDFRVIWGEK